MSDERSLFGPKGIAGGPLTEVVKIRPGVKVFKRGLAAVEPGDLHEAAQKRRPVVEVKPSRFVLELRRHVEQRWPFWACRDAVEACGDDLAACVGWLKTRSPGDRRSGPQGRTCVCGGAVSPIEQAAADLATASKYVELFEHHAGKKCSARMRKWLKDAVMAGIKHGRTTVPKSPEQERHEELLRKLHKPGGPFS